ncbi:MAG: divergent PAP2 family protein [Candidatus Moranbacteria bacterium]|jgi:acid phosphatase family membrane protein YuiD|nr:divergent PAP2 family protein [Candidatus Moranbacteria bacterium]
MEILQPYLVFLIPITVGILTQALKFALYTYKHGFNIEYAFTHGHMPSAHTSLVVSLLTSVAYYEGIHSGSFALSAVLAFIVIDDAARIRMYLGDQGRYLNMLVDQLNLNQNNFPRLKERVGHRISEIIGGAFVGLFFTLFLINIFG